MTLKNIFAHVCLVALAIGNLASAAPLKNDSIKNIICARLESDFYSNGVRLADCLKGQFDVVAEKSSQVGGRNISTLLEVNSFFKSKSFGLILKKSFTVNDSGSIKIGDWSVSKIRSSDMGAESNIVAKAKVGDANVKIIKAARELPQGVLDWEFYASATDYDLEDTKYYIVLDPKNANTIIGYIVEEYTSCSETDSKDLVTARFDASANMVSEPDQGSWE